MSNRVCEARCRMKKKRVILEPELELVAGHLDVFDRLVLAEKLERFVRQLRVSAKAMSQQPWKRQRPPRIGSHLAALN